MYTSYFSASDKALKVLTQGKILGPGETPQEMIERVVKTLTDVEKKFNTSLHDTRELAQKFGLLLDEKACVMSTPILTNTGRHLHKPLSACSVPPINLRTDSKSKIREVIMNFHQEGMGTGFNLDDITNPTEMLTLLNAFAIESTETGNEERPVGNMAILSVYHPALEDFIHAKVSGDQEGVQWKFNISVNCDAAFFDALASDSTIERTDGAHVSARKIFDMIAQASHACADPGLIFFDRMEDDNPTPGIARYEAPAPCAEVGLAPGESCQFAYINLGKYVTTGGSIDLEKLRNTTHLLTRILDNALEISIANYSEELNKYVMSQKRKIGIGICGLADMFVQLGIPYSSEKAIKLAQDLVAFINYESKLASHELAKTRGSFGGMSLSLGNKHLEFPSFIEKKYGSLETAYVSGKQWRELANTIRTTKLLRHASTIALPPTGRSGLVIDASTSIEPIFSREDYLLLHPELSKDIVFETATELSPVEHLHMAAAIQHAVDESISKTVNMPAHATPAMIAEIHQLAWDTGLKGISIYREGSKKFQPKKLN